MMHVPIHITLNGYLYSLYAHFSRQRTVHSVAYSKMEVLGRKQ